LELKRAELQRSINSQTVEIWPENWRACTLFFAMGTQWDVVDSMNGTRFNRLRYEVLDTVERRLPPDDAPEPTSEPDLFEKIRTLERAALVQLNKT